MKASANTVRMTPPIRSEIKSNGHSLGETEQPSKPAQAQLVSLPRNGNGHGPQSLRMYTEEQVAEMLQVSLSQLRKWRMKQHEGKQTGPPFRKIGRLVRYPESALLAYINGEE